MKELENFRKFLAEGQINEGVSPAALAKVFQDEIRDAKFNEEDDVVPAYEKGIEMLKQGVLPEKVNGIVQDMYVKITGDFSYDPTVFIDAAREIDAKGQLNENMDPKTSMWARNTMDSVFDGVYDEPEVGKVISYEFNDVNDEVEYEVGPDFYKVGEQPVVAYEDEDMKVTLRKLDPNDPKAVKFNHTHQLAATIKRVVR